jgi:hypothetical protein
MAYQSLVALPLNRSRSSQLSCLGSGIPSLVGGWFRFEGYKMWCGFISLDQFRFKGRVIEGTQTLDLFSMAGGLFRIKSVLGRPGKTDWIERRCLCLFFIDRIPIRPAKETRARHRTCSILNLHPSLVISIRFSYSLVHCALQLAAPCIVRENASALASYN